jgi:hypothetical protein
MTHVFQSRVELSSCHGHGSYDLVYKHGTPGDVFASPGSYQIGSRKRGYAE